MTTIYIAGPMRGIPWFNFPAFDKAATALTLKGYNVINPAQLDRKVGFNPNTLPVHTDWNVIPPHFDLDAAIRRDVDAIMRSDELCLLPGWQNSKGANAEKQLAEWRGMKVWELEPETILDEASRLVMGNRQADYGHPAEDFARTAGMWRALFGWDVKPEDVALAMVLVKLSREKHKSKRDNRVDGCGYLACYEMVLERQASE